MALDETRARQIGMNEIEIGRLEQLMSEGYIDEGEIETLLLNGNLEEIEEEIIEAEHERSHDLERKQGRVHEG
jgi:hypothetical protein